MSAQRESIPGYYRPSSEQPVVVRAALDLGEFAFSHVEGFVVLSVSIACLVAAAVLWGG